MSPQTIPMSSITLTNCSEVALVDLEFQDEVKKYKWYRSRNSVISRVGDNNPLKKFITELGNYTSPFTPNIAIYHIDHNNHNCQLANLKVVYRKPWTRRTVSKPKFSLNIFRIIIAYNATLGKLPIPEKQKVYIDISRITQS